MRKNYIDNIRWFCILMLFPYHTFMIYNSFGENFYVKGVDISVTTGFIIATSSWFMPLLFVIAGISSAYALQKRKNAEYLKERISKLLTPLIFGILLLVPIQTFFAEKFHNGYTGGYFEQYKLFFTKITDLTGYTGGFTTGQLWFLLYLFVISVITLPIIKKLKLTRKIPNIPMWGIVSMFLFPLIMAPILDVGGKSIGEFLAYFLLGYILLSNENILEKLDKYRFGLLSIAIISIVILVLLWFLNFYNTFNIQQIVYDVFMRFCGWITIIAVIGMSRHYFNFRNRTTDYLSASSFPIYIFHQSVLVMVSYYVFKFTDNALIQIITIMSITIIGTYIMYEIFKRLSITRFMFAIKKM